MRRVALFLAACVAGVSAIGLYAQQADSIASTNNPPLTSQSVPRLIMFSGTVEDLTGKPLTGPVDLNFAIYKEQTDAAPLWQENQTLNVDEQGHYTALLGAMQAEGLPVDLFTSGEARWLGVSAGKLPEQPRVLLVSVPYALKANDAEMLAGKPASAYALAQPAGASTSAGTATAGTTAPGGAGTSELATPGKPKSGPKPNLAGTGTQNYIPVWTNSSGTLGNSVIYQSSGLVGIGTTTPAARLDVAGSVGHFLVDTSGAQFRFTRGGANYFLASTAGGYFDFVANGLTPSDANASLKLAANGVVNFMAGNVGIGTPTPAQKLEVNGSLKISGTGNALIFPDGTMQSTAGGGGGGGGGTITGVTAGTGLSGGGTAGNVTLSLAIGGVNGIKEFFSSGIFSVPPNITHLMIEMWGGGGGAVTPSCPMALEETGGGGGAYTRTVVAVLPGATYSISVGAGGAAGGGNGGASEIRDPSSNVLAFAGGGQGGQLNGTTAGGQPDPSAMISHAGGDGQQAAWPGYAYALNLLPNSDIGRGGTAYCGGIDGTTPVSSPGGPGYVLITW